MVKAFCPGHISCIFQPVSSYNIQSTGSRGVGIRLSMGATSEVSLRNDDSVIVRLNGRDSIAQVTRMACEILAPGIGFDIDIHTDLPISQGFAMSAAGTLATSICIAQIVGKDRTSAFEAAHNAEILGGGGMGDVSAIVAGGDVPIRVIAGLPPHGNVKSAGFTIPNLTLAVIGSDIRTDTVLGDQKALTRIRDVGSEQMEQFMQDPTLDRLYETSNRFSSETGLETPKLRETMDRLSKMGYRSGMCMLGNSMFTDAPADLVRSILGRGHVKAFECSSSHREIAVTRTR